MLVSGTFDEKARVVLGDMPTKRPRRALRGDERNVRAVAFSRDGRTVASGGDDHFVTAWDTRIGGRIGRIELAARTFAMAFGPDGLLLQVAHEPGRVLSRDRQASMRPLR